MMNHRTLLVFLFKIFCISALALPAANAEPHFFEDSPFPLELRDGAVLSVTSIEIQHGIDGRRMFVYRTASGAEGYKWEEQIANFDRLMSIIAPAPKSTVSESIQPAPEEESTAESPEAEADGPESDDGAPPEDIVDRCTLQWGSESGMFEDCIEQQSAAARWIQEQYGGRSDLSKAEYRIVNGCANQWSDQILEKNNYDYAGIKSCIEQQMHAYKGGSSE